MDNSRHDTRRPCAVAGATGALSVSCWLSAVVTITFTVPPGSRTTLIPTIRDAAQIILETQLSNVTEEDFLARALAELEELSDEEVQKLLAQDDTY